MSRDRLGSTAAIPPSEGLSHLFLLQRILSREAHVFLHGPERLTSHMHNMLYLDEGDDGPASALLARAREALAERSWLRLLNRPQVNRSVLLRVLNHGATVWALAWSPSGDLLASAGGDGVVRIWKAATGTPVCLLEAHAGQANALSWSPDGATLASGHDDGTVRLWDVAGFRQQAVLTGHSEGVLALAWSPDGTHLASGGSNTVWLWDVSSGRQGTLVVKQADSIFYAVAWSPEGSFFASGGSDGIVRLWDRAAEECAVLEDLGLKELVGRGMSDSMAKAVQFQCNVMALAWSPDGRILASGSRIGALRLWEPATGTPMELLVGAGEAGVPSIAWSPDKTLLAWGSGEGHVYLGDPVRRQQLRFQEGHNRSVWALAWSPDGRVLASGSEDDTIRLWDARTLWDQAPKIAKPIEGHGGSVYGVAWSGDGSVLASGSAYNDVRLWDATTGTPLAKIEKLNGPVIALAPHVEGVVLAPIEFSGVDTTVSLWKGPQEAPKSLVKMDGMVFALAVSPDGKLIASGDIAGTVWVREAASGKPVAVFMREKVGNQTKSEPSPVWALSWSPGGTLLASVSRDATIVWDIITGKERAVLEVATTPLEADPLRMGEEALTLQREAHAAAWSPDGTLLASDSSDCSVRLWDPATGKAVAVLEGHTASVCALAWCPVGGLLASGSDDLTVRLWDVKTVACLAVAHCLSPVRALRFRGDGRILYVADEGSATGNRPLPYLFKLCNI